MQVLLGLLMAALIGVDDTADSYAAPKMVVSRAGVLATKGGPMVAFEIRDIRVSSPEWRGKLILRMQPVTRQEGTAVWSLDPAGFKELLDLCQADPRSNVLQAPTMSARVGDPARMTSEETHQYVASVKRVADGPPNRATKLAFEPQLDKVHNGVRVNVLSSQIKGQNLFARVVIDENRLVAIHMVKYTEAVQPKPGADPEVSKASFLDRLNPNHGPRAAAINATIQVPEVDSRRVEGEWLIPSDGALLVSLGPRALHERGFQQKGYEEHLIAITARPLAEPAQAPVQRPATAGSPKPR
ncbi:MAG: hypothetical protein WA746_01690 [Isosphaeraceae bacterium]